MPRTASRAESSLVILKRRIPGLNEASLARFLVRARRAAGLRDKVNVLVTGDRELQRLNRRFRGHNKATDVLSFPALSGARNGLAGDVAISAEIAATNARRFGHDAAEEIKVLVLHGVLHLAGYDHENDHGEMARKEQHLRRALRLPIGLIERAPTAGAHLRRKFC
jgi:probable rRNA maturation factor